MNEQFKPVKIGEVSADGKFTLVSRDDPPALDNLRQEVREAWQRIVADEQRPEDFECIQAELLRLAGSLTARQTIDAISRAERAEAELAALKARIQWRPLSTAPTDGTCILVSDADGDVRQAKWDKPGWWCGYDCYGNDAFVERPTHWMPLPPPPKGEE